MAVKHAFTNPKADGGDATIVRPSNWNADHTIDPGSISRAQLDATGKGWQFLGGSTLGSAAVTVGPLVFPAGTWDQIMFNYCITGYSNVAVGRILMGAASLSTTALTNGGRGSEGVTLATSMPSIPGAPLAVTVSNIARFGWGFLSGNSGAFKKYEIIGQNGAPSVSTPPISYRHSGNFSDLGTNLPLQRMQMSVYDTLTATALSTRTFNTGTYLYIWGRNDD